MSIVVRQTSAIAAYPGSGSSGTTAVNSFSSAVLAGSCIVVLNVAGDGGSSGATISVADGINSGNYTTAVQGTTTGSVAYPQVCGSFYPNVAAGTYSAITGTNTAGAFNCYGFQVALEITGLGTTGILDAAPAAASSNSGTDATTNSTGTLVQASEIAFAVCAMLNSGNQTFAEPSGFTNVALADVAATYSDIQGSVDYQIVSAETALSASWGAPSSTCQWIAIIFTLKGAGATPTTLMGQILT